MTPQPHHRPSVPPIVGIITGIAAVSSASILIRFAQSEKAPSLVIAAARLTLASLILVPLALTRFRDEYRHLTRGDQRLAVLSGVFLALHFATWITSLEYTTVASSTVIVSSSPLFVAVASWLILREGISCEIVIGLSVTLVGGVIVSLTDTGGTTRNALLGDALALGGAITVAGYLLIGRRLRTKLSIVPYTAAVYGTAAVIMLLIVIVAGQSFTGYRPIAYVWLVLLALGPQLIGHSSFNWALAHLPTTFVAVATLGEPIGSTILAFIILSETPSPLKLVGAGLILSGIAIAAYRTSGQGTQPATRT